MNFSPQVEILMKPFIKSFGKCNKTILSKEEIKTFNNILISIYDDINESNQNVLDKGCFKYEIVDISSDNDNLKRPENFSNSRYFPTKIQHYINENEQYQIAFSCGNVGNREINIFFTLFDKNDLSKLDIYVQQVRMMYVWLNICAKYASKYCTNTLDIYIFPTPFTKNLPGSTTSIIGPEHVNTAFTFACIPKGQLLIFREEEWFKVFLHETFHAYGLDFANSNINDVKRSLFSLFPIDSDFDIYESYTETWARIINCAFCSFNALEDKTDIKNFITNTIFCIELERMFALYQCIKILNFMGLHYHDLHNKSSSYMRTKLYKENTHVFAYYILTAVFLNDYQGFVLWCKKNNKVLLKFDSTPKNFKAFEDYIVSIYNCISLQNGFDHMGRLNGQINRSKNKTLINSTRMSIIHTI
jgi:hypothetical protein